MQRTLPLWQLGHNLREVHAGHQLQDEEMMSDTTMDSTNKVGVFMQQMIPRHANAVNMARILLTQVDAATIESAIEEGGLTDLLNDIINVQNFQIHQFRNYLGSVGLLPSTSTSTATTDEQTTTDVYTSGLPKRHFPWLLMPALSLVVAP